VFGSIVMRKIFLIMADTDVEYIERLSVFIMNNYPNRFKLTCFTNPAKLKEFLIYNKVKTDIIAAETVFYNNIPKDYSNFTKIIFSEGNVQGISSNGKGYILNKYQHGDQIVRDIISIYDKTCNTSFASLSGNTKTKTVFVYSPAGGTGNTVLSLGLSILGAREGLNIFILSLEYLGSISLYLNDSNNNSTLSNILYYMEEDNSNISLKIESLRSVDPYYGIHFFSPPECDMEILQANNIVIENLINGLKNLMYYDYIIVDIPSFYGISHIKSFYLADIIFCVICNDPVCLHKYRRWKVQASLLLKDDDINQLDNISIILNKYRGIRLDTNELPDTNIDFTVPAFDNAQNNILISSLTSPSNPFSNSILDIVKKSFFRGLKHE
jgi:cellulose biosynthesis protein BcsQ